MYLPHDPDMLYSMVNMKLRDTYNDIYDLCDGEDLDVASLMVRLNQAGYEYNEATHKFMPKLAHDDDANTQTTHHDLPTP